MCDDGSLSSFQIFEAAVGHCAVKIANKINENVSLFTQIFESCCSAEKKRG
jgi:hypothetical protein